MKNRLLDEYRGPITPAEATEGINAARRNARRLASDARLLLDAERYHSSAAIAVLSIEESGKVSILRGLATEKTPEGLKAEWINYRNHRSKSGAWILPELAVKGARRLHELSEITNREGEHTAIINIVKQIGMYTDCYKKGHWSEPEKVIDAKLTRSLVWVAELLARGEDVSVRELQLWVEHMGPVWRTPEMPQALMRWATAMHREGLSKHTPEEYARFVFGEAVAADWKSEPPQTH